KRAYCLKTQPATGETYPKSDLFNKAIAPLKTSNLSRVRVQEILQRVLKILVYIHIHGTVLTWFVMPQRLSTGC
ncbi:hypothetical protein RZP58_18210, partial [Klebsiella quasipneumoniae subsp. similipneumoniae]|uniref:hypothetical protein n=1 Tax=Klebsiella quasipneumoniae TaxID=1463165 RepID=UPI00292C3AE2